MSDNQELSAIERLDIAPAVQGIWRMIASSKDNGKTWGDGNAHTMCRVFSTKVRLSDGQELIVDRILIVDDGGDGACNMISFSNRPVWWVITQKNTAILVQVLIEDFDETIRFICAVEQ
jgi:hypothetical protein